MPHTKSAKKSLRKDIKRRAHNRAIKKTVKKQIKTLLEAIKTGAPDAIRKEYNLTAKKLDKAGARRVIHPNLAARKKSQLALKVNAKLNAPAPTQPAKT
ncbi:MAG: 30S ribosomal protein S20 [Gemmataceae bacterium]|nr:30S ribosomal protein S20 [Gemmataceae bacterium]